MRNKLIVLLILLITSLFPCLVNAEVCQKDDIKINSIETVETRGNIEEISNPTTDNNQVNLGIKMNVIDDSITYRVVLKNTSSSDYVFDKNQIEKDYINYEITYDDEENIIKAGEEKVIYLKLNYSNKPQVEQLSNGVLTEINQVSFNMINEKGDSLINPETGNKTFYIYLIVIILITIILLKNKKKASIVGLVIILLLIPSLVKASCTCTLDVKLNLEIDAKEAIFLPGKELNVKMKQLAGDDTSTEERQYYFQNQTITAIKKSSAEPSESNKEEKNVVSTTDSTYPIYMWYTDGTIYWWSEDKTPSLNEDAASMFYYMASLVDISGVESYDLSSTTKLAGCFAYTNMSSIEALEKWDTSKITSINLFLGHNKSLINTKGIENWNVSNITNMAHMFRSCFALEEANFSNWNTKSLTDITGIFAMVRDNGAISYDGSLKRLYLSDKFNTSNITSLQNFLVGQDEIEDYSFLQYIDTSNVTNFNGVFINNSNLTEDTYFKNWDVSSAENFHVTLSGCRNLKSVDLSKWNPKEIKDLRYMFSNDTSLEEVDISGLDTSKTTKFSGMFYGVNKLKRIIVGDKWTTEANEGSTQDFFPSRCELPNFSTSNPNYKDLSYAHTGEGGYLTLKTN